MTGNWTIDEEQSVDNQSLLSSEIIKTANIRKRSDVPTYYLYKTHWRNGKILYISVYKYINTQIQYIQF